MAYNSYKTFIESLPSTKADIYKNIQQQFINEQFENSPTYKIIQKVNRETDVETDIGVRIVKPFDIGSEDKTYSDDYCQILFKDLDEDIRLGDMFSIDGYRWMSIETKGIAGITKTILVKRCNVVIKLATKSPILTNYNTLYGISNVRLYDVNDEQYKITPKAEMSLDITYNAIAKSIILDAKRGSRFLIGNPVQAWQVVNMDSITNVKIDESGNSDDGFATLKLVQTQIHPDDDLVNNIAWQLYF